MSGYQLGDRFSEEGPGWVGGDSRGSVTGGDGWPYVVCGKRRGGSSDFLLVARRGRRQPATRGGDSGYCGGLVALGEEGRRDYP